MCVCYAVFYEFLYPMYPVSCGGKNCLALLSPSTIESTWQNKRPRVRVSCSIFFHELLFGTSWNTFIWFSDSFTTIVPSFGEPCFFTGHFPAKRSARSIVRRLIRRRIRRIFFPLDSEQFQPPAVRRVSRDFWRLIVEPRWRLKEAKGKLWHFLTKYSCFCCVKWQEFAEYKKCVENCTFFTENVQKYSTFNKFLHYFIMSCTFLF